MLAHALRVVLQQCFEVRFGDDEIVEVAEAAFEQHANGEREFSIVAKRRECIELVIELLAVGRSQRCTCVKGIGGDLVRTHMKSKVSDGLERRRALRSECIGSLGSGIRVVGAGRIALLETRGRGNFCGQVVECRPESRLRAHFGQ